MGPAPRWPWSVLRYLTPIILIVLVLQYFLGLWTNVYGPTAGFTSNTSFPSLDWHYNLGFLLGLTSLVAIILSALARDAKLVLGSVVLFVSVYIAGNAGNAYVSSTPNAPIDSFVMGVMFLVALVAALAMAYRLWTAKSPTPVSTPSVAPA